MGWHPFFPATAMVTIMARHPSNPLTWTLLRVWVEDPALHATRELPDRRAIAALARWKTGEVAGMTVVDVRDAGKVSNPAEVDWTGFPSVEPDG
jgi:hypothetical protein